MLTQQQRLLLTHRLYTLARTNFVAFLTAMYPQGVGRPYVLTKFHLALADHVQQMSEGVIGPHQSISAPPQHGKALANNTLIPTPSGLARIDSLVPGSEVFAADGTVTQVLAVKEWKNRPVYKLTISDGTEILADENHDWSVCLPDKSSRFQVLSTKVLAERKSPCFPLLPVAAGVLRQRFIERIEPAGNADVTCIQVAHPSSLFLCTAAHIPTHNSQLLAVRAVAWLVGRYPGINIALTGFSRSLLVGFLAGTKEIIESRAYQRIFPSLHALPGYDRSDFIRLSNNSTVIVKSAGSKLTGRGADWLIVDDAHAGRAEAESDILRQKVITWFKSDCLTRISPSAKILVIGTRFHKEDLIGTVGSEAFARALEDAGQGHRIFQHTNFQAIYDGRNPDPLGRSDGAPLAPETRPMDFLKGQQAMLFGYEWDAQYQGNPGAYTVGQVDVSKLQYCNAADVPKDIRRTRGWDTALSEKQTADYTAGARCSADDGYFYIEDITSFRAAWPVARKRVSELAIREKETHGIHRIGVEGVAGFGVVVQSLRELLLGEVSVTQRNPPKGGKLLRAQPWLVKIEAGKVVLVRGPWNAGFVRQLEQFPNGSHDDEVDSVSISHEELFNAQRLLLA